MRSARAGSSGVGGAEQASWSSKICCWCWPRPRLTRSCKPASWMSTGTARQTRASWGWRDPRCPSSPMAARSGSDHHADAIATEMRPQKNIPEAVRPPANGLVRPRSRRSKRVINVSWDIGIHREREIHGRVAGMAAGPTRFLFGSSWSGRRLAGTGCEWSGKQKWRASSASRVQADGAKMGAGRCLESGLPWIPVRWREARR